MPGASRFTVIVNPLLFTTILSRVPITKPCQSNRAFLRRGQLTLP
jgi:hypothetical protein